MATTKSIDIMLSRPGIYVVVSPVAVLLCEIDPEHRCYQLRLDDYSRDGELRPGGWLLPQIEAIFGPFARAT